MVNYANKRKKRLKYIHKDMNIIVNGGSKGIGKEVIIHLAKDQDNKIIVTGRDESALQRLAETAEYKNIRFMVIDLIRLSEKLKSIQNEVLSQFDAIDILINNAGNLVSKKFVDMHENEARKMMEINFFAPATLIRVFQPYMRNGSHIVNISSMGAFQGSTKYSGLSYYSASKSALACLSECLASELSGSGIKVNCLALGSVQTEMLDEAFPGYKAPLTAKEMAEFIADFALNGGRFFNGKIIPVALGNP